MNTQANLDIEVAIAKQIKAKPEPSKPLETSKDTFGQFERQLEQRKNDVLQRKQEQRLRDPQVRAQLRQQQRVNTKVPLFAKLLPIMAKELQVLKLEINQRNERFKIRNFYFQISDREMWQNLRYFEHNLKNLRQSTCMFKYGTRRSTCQSACFWVSCWCIMPLYCCYHDCLKQSTAHKILRETYEKYERMMVQENEIVAIPTE